MTAPASAYPRTVDDLMPAARQVPVRDGELVPSLRRLMSTLNVGQEKAKEIRARLIEEGAQRDLEARPEPVDPARLLRPAVERSEATGILPTADDLILEYGIDPAQAELLAELTRVAVERRAAGLPTDLDLTWARRPVGVDGPPTSTPERTDEPEPDTDDTEPEPTPDPEPVAPPAVPAVETTGQARVDVDTDDTAAPVKGKPVVVWPVWVMLAPAFVSVWAGWVGLGERTGYGVMNLLPGFTNKAGDPLLVINTAITLPIGMEVYAAYALYVCLSGRVPPRARKFAGWSAAISLIVGAAGQVTYHLLAEANDPTTPWGVTMAVSCIPVAVLGMGAALAHLVRSGGEDR